MKIVDLTLDYPVGASEAFLTVVIGDAQFGTSRATKDGNVVADGAVNNTSLGNNLAGKQVIIKSLVSDVRDQTDRTSITYTVAGGPAPLTLTAKSFVDNPGESMVYRAILSFK